MDGRHCLPLTQGCGNRYDLGGQGRCPPIVFFTPEDTIVLTSFSRAINCTKVLVKGLVTKRIQICLNRARLFIRECLCCWAEPEELSNILEGAGKRNPPGKPEAREPDRKPSGGQHFPTSASTGILNQRCSGGPIPGGKHSGSSFRRISWWVQGSMRPNCRK